jgi:adenylate kinase family enzyme
MQRIVIIGTSCCGKTTLAKVVSSVLNTKHIELDALHWKPNWIERETDDFKSLVVEEIMEENWVVDGNYSAILDILWSRSTTIIWLNYSFVTVLYRAIYRSFKRSLTKEVIFSGNRESFKRSFLSQESIILWVIKTHRKRREKYSSILYNNTLQNNQVIELKSQSETDDFIRNLRKKHNKKIQRTV